MKNLALFLLVLFCSLPGFAQRSDRHMRELLPIIDYMRSAPAWVGGHLILNNNHIAFEDARTKLTVLKGKSIHYSLREDEVSLRIDGSISLSYLGFPIRVKSVQWSKEKGFKTDSLISFDITGLTRSKISQEVAETLEKELGAKMILANQQLYRVRKMQKIGTTLEIIENILDIFSSGSSSPMPTYKGEAAVLFFPKEDKAFSLQNMRIGIHKGDVLRFGFNFNGNESGVYPFRFTTQTNQGININQGKNFKQNARMVLKELVMDRKGAELEMHLGASETLGTILTLAEEIARRTGRPVQRCQQCWELAELPPMRLAVEGLFRAALIDQLEDYEDVLMSLRVNPAHLAQFKRVEGCKIRGAEDTRQCRLKVDGDAKIKACIGKAMQRMNSCLK
jgi:hypothetical protein